MADLSAEEEALSNAVSRIVEDSSASGGTNWPGDMRYPWEIGFAANIFGPSTSTTPDFLRMATLPPAPKPIPRPSTRTLTGQAYLAVAKKRMRKSWAQQGHASRDRAVQRWKLVLSTNLRASVAGRTMIREASLGGSDESQVQQLQDILAPKATSTLAKRAGPILKFIAWCQIEGVDPLPMQEGGGLPVLDRTPRMDGSYLCATTSRSCLVCTSCGRAGWG